MFEFMSTKWPRAFMLVAVFQLAICLAFESYVFAEFHFGTNDDGLNNNSNDPVSSQFQTIPTFLALLIFGFIYDVALVWDALRMKNTIQIIIICIANLAFIIYSALQIDQINKAINVIETSDAQRLASDPQRLTNDQLWSDIRPFLIALPCIIAFVFVVMCFISWKLYQEFAWDILKHIGADYRMKRRFLHYQIYIALLKFDFFFFLGFTVQFLVVVGRKVGSGEFGVTAAAIPFCVIILFLAAFFTKRENKPGMIAIIVFYLAALSYFFFKLVRIYQPSHELDYMPVRKTITAFAVLTIVLIILTIINAFICMSNFNTGLKRHLLAPRGPDVEKPDLNSIDLNNVKPQLPSRMTID